MAERVVDGLDRFFDEISNLLGDAERQYGIADQRYSEYIIERFEHCIHTCLDVVGHIRTGAPESANMEEYCSSLQELIQCLESIVQKWVSYNDLLESGTRSQHFTSYQTPLQSHAEHYPGRPKFVINKEQLLYLSSLSFNWSEVAALLGVSRMTVYRLV